MDGQQRGAGKEGVDMALGRHEAQGEEVDV